MKNNKNIVAVIVAASALCVLAYMSYTHKPTVTGLTSATPEPIQAAPVQSNAELALIESKIAHSRAQTAKIDSELRATARELYGEGSETERRLGEHLDKVNREFAEVDKSFAELTRQLNEADSELELESVEKRIEALEKALGIKHER